ncbi:MAG TPA: type II toxin-antitoxin system RelE/ParE family toxin [Candidatus Sulfotelmatobacter sp.]|nr:type II toxin-antitoxin system RelE/ParE family toxin [Candidatus Sulfotelmatobacter sp.]
MRRRIIFDTEARREFEDAVVWYNRQQPGLGDRFEAEIHATFLRILANPEKYRSVSHNIRQVKVEIFNKYSVYFRLERDFIGIVSVFHGARNPEELHRRLK